MFEPLLTFDPESSELLPGIAQSWESHDGGSRFVFRLSETARFHNGRRVTAEDVTFSLNRLARKATESEAEFLLDSVIGFEKVNITAETEDLEGVGRPDEFSVEVRLNAPWMDFPYVLTHPSTAPIPKPEFESDPEGFAQRPLGSGPYRLAGPFRPGEDIRLERFAGYRGRSGSIREISLVVYEQGERAWRDFEAGMIDVAEVPVGRIGFARSKYGEAGFSPLAAGVYLGFNLTNPKFADPRLRQAISLGIDRESMARFVFQDAVYPAHGIVPSGIAGRSLLACGDLCQRDPERARALLAEAFPGGAPEIVYDYPSGPPDDGVATSLKASLADIGLTVTLRSHERELHAYFDLLEARQQEMFRLIWPAEYPVADWFLTPLFKSGSPDNHSGYSHPEIDQLLLSARSAEARRERMALYRQIEERVVPEMAVIPLGFFQNRYAAGPKVTGFYADRLGTFEVRRLRLSGA